MSQGLKNNACSLTYHIKTETRSFKKLTWSYVILIGSVFTFIETSASTSDGYCSTLAYNKLLFSTISVIL